MSMGSTNNSIPDRMCPVRGSTYLFSCPFFLVSSKLLRFKGVFDSSFSFCRKFCWSLACSRACRGTGRTRGAAGRALCAGARGGEGEECGMICTWGSSTLIVSSLSFVVDSRPFDICGFRGMKYLKESMDSFNVDNPSRHTKPPLR